MFIDINSENPIFQSPYTYIQAAGSDGSDNTSLGIHLRWDFLRELGKEHLPKGELGDSRDYHSGGSKYNKENDFVSIYKMPFKETCYIQVDLSERPNRIIQKSNQVEWQYRLSVIDGDHNTTVMIIFKNTNLYNYISQQINPNQNPLEFLCKYTDVIQIYTPNKLIFRAQFKFDKNPYYDLKNPNNTNTGLEAISLVHDNFDATNNADKYYISCRKSINYHDFEYGSEITCENIEYFRFKGNQFIVTSITLYTYEDYIRGLHRDFNFLDRFSLSLDQEKVFKLLEPQYGSIDGTWPKFYYEDMSEPILKVNIANYHSRWGEAFGLEHGVKRYLELSRYDSQAIDYLESDVQEDNGISQISYLDMLKLVSSDYHIARMLGLGQIDSNTTEGKYYVYVMTYDTEVEMESFIREGRAKHLFMTLPTSIHDFRTPPTPTLKPITYGLESNELHNTPFALTDNHGYSRFSDERFINLTREEYLFERRFEDFFATNIEFCLCEQSLPIGYGVGYRNNNESKYRVPNIAHDINYLDHRGIPETIFIPENGNTTVFTHSEVEEGIHVYSLYSINWFSRISPISNEEYTDTTIFNKKNTIIPPSNLNTQLIQKENTLLFTTELEQQQLSNISTADKTLVRVTFDWNHIHNQSYQFANYVEFLFRESEPTSITGKIAQVSILSNDMIKINTTSLNIQSSMPPQTIRPYISSNSKEKYIGSMFVADNQYFIIEDIIPGENPSFTIRPIRETIVTDVDNNNIFSHSHHFIAPSVGSSFLVIENLDLDITWDSKLNKKVYLEQFHTVSEIEVQDANKTIYFPINEVQYTNNNTKITLDKVIPSTLLFNYISYNKTVKVVQHNNINRTFIVEGDITSEIVIGGTITIKAAHNIDGIYTISQISSIGTTTTIKVNESFSQGPNKFYLVYKSRKSVINHNNDTITIAGNFTQDFIAPYKEREMRTENTDRNIVIGGLFKKATITEFQDKDANGYSISNSHTGIYSITINNYTLAPHIDEDIQWYKGIVRVMENSQYLPTSIEGERYIPKMKELQVWDIINDNGNLKLIAADVSFNVDNNYNPINDYIPILTGSNISINFHPSYKLYLRSDNNNGSNFNEQNILPSTGQQSKYTYLTARAIDTTISPVIKSYITRPTNIIAQKINEPLAPSLPTGPLYATRPDFYGKATYTFDIEINTTNRTPDMILCYRSSENQILYKLYKSHTVKAIINTLEDLEPIDKSFMNDRWNDLANGFLDINGLFKQYTPNGYRFPIPNNNLYSYTNTQGNKVYPFNGNTMPSDLIIKDAINSSFIPLTEQPIPFAAIKSGKQTSPAQPTIRDNNGNILSLSDSNFNPAPMAVKFTENNKTYVRFTDYKLDGASRNMFFYCATEISNQLIISEPSPISGPIHLVNSFPAEEPVIRKISQKQDNNIIQPAISLEINKYLENEDITNIQIYRSTNATDSLSVRTMKLVKTLDINEQLIDDFADVTFPLYGEPLFYRVVALREILNEYNQIEYIPSKASNIVLSNIIDNINPMAPTLSFTGDWDDTTLQQKWNDVILTWDSTCYNGTYYLYTMTKFGTWQKIYEVKSNDATISIALINTSLNTDIIYKQDEDGNTIYKRFRVEVENSSGLFNIEQKELTI